MAIFQKLLQGRINNSGGPYQRQSGALFSYFSGGSFFWMHFLVVVVAFKPTLNVQTSKQRGKNLAADRGPPGGGGGAPMVQPAQ